MKGDVGDVSARGLHSQGGRGDQRLAGKRVGNDAASHIIGQLYE